MFKYVKDFRVWDEDKLIKKTNQVVTSECPGAGGYEGEENPQYL